MFVIAGTIQVDPAKRQEAVGPAAEMMRETRMEPGNIEYAFSLDMGDETIIRVFEQWESQEALDLHFAAPHMATFRKVLGELGVTGMDMKRYEIESVGPLFS
ncbi:MAG: putative quinol monooxygenase [Myxococcota bacterium]|jgi:quinol monooxygenase YgiN|nr:putative quinol monooxygenase [Myxococcota bacterium]